MQELLTSWRTQSSMLAALAMLLKQSNVAALQNCFDRHHAK